MTDPVTFVTTELDPELPGGAGTVVDLLSRRLADEGVDVTVVLVTDAEPPQMRPRPGVELRVVAADGSDEESPFLARSHAAAAALAGGETGRVEFVDFDGLGFWTLAHRRDLGLSGAPVTVRLHGPVDLMREAMGVSHPEWDHVVAMERGVFQMADAVVVPSDRIADLAADRYEIDRRRLVVGRPPIPAVARVERQPAESPEFAALGRLGEVKGSHDLLRAAVPVLRDRPGSLLRYLGSDGWSVTAGTPMREWLRSQVPPDVAAQVRFEPPVERATLPESLRTAWAVVIPSRFESFCLAAHEARAMGMAVVVPDLPAFRGILGPDTGALVYDGTVDGLEQALRRLASDRDLRDRLASRHLPAYGDPLAPYLAEPPPIRPEREQAGLATVAVKALERVSTPDVEEPSDRLRRLAQEALRRMPQPVADLAVRVLPQGIKDRFRQIASWPEEEERRRREEERQLVLQRIASGDFPDLERPEVTVVVPCYNQGRFLEDALLSVFRQTMTSFEVVVVDDGSDDPHTREVLDTLDLPRVRLVRQPNRGLPAARNAGIRAGRGRYVVPLDADDQLTPGFLEALRGPLDDDPTIAFAHCWAELFGERSAIFANRPYNPYQELLSNSVTGCVLLRREAWSAVGGYDETMRQGNEDWDLWIRLQAAGWEQQLVRAPLFRYRKHGVSMSVETEARFDEGRREMARRHPDLYAPRSVRELKDRWYPLVSVLSPGAPRRSVDDDVEFVPLRGADRADAVRDARGKYVVDGGAVASSDALRLWRDLALRLEDRPSAGGVVVDGTPVLWRRWTLLDADAPHDQMTEVTASAAAPLEIAGDSPLRPGAFPTPGWTIALDLPDPALPVARQDPEEAGIIPDWINEESGQVR